MALAVPSILMIIWRGWMCCLLRWPFDEFAARRFGALKASLENDGQPLHDLDLQIAGIALENDLPLLTHNRKHFERIEKLKLEDWLE
jgi:tRNA(fMet)-specific endonuclease VapC